MSDPKTPHEVLARCKRKGWKPDAQGRLIFRPRGLFGSGYVVETGEQLDRIEKFERTKITLMVVVGGAAIATVLPFQSDANEGAVIGGLVVVLALVAGLVGYALIGGSRIVTGTAMRALP